MQKIRKKNRAKITKKNKFITYIQKRIYAKRWDLMKMQKQKYIYIYNELPCTEKKNSRTQIQTKKKNKITTADEEQEIREKKKQNKSLEILQKQKI